MPSASCRIAARSRARWPGDGARTDGLRRRPHEGHRPRPCPVLLQGILPGRGDDEVGLLAPDRREGVGHLDPVAPRTRGVGDRRLSGPVLVDDPGIAGDQRVPGRRTSGARPARGECVVADVLEEVHPIEQLHGEEPVLAVGDQLIERDEMGMGDAQEGAKLLLEAEDRGGAGPAHHLEGDRAAALAVVRAEDDTHPAAAEPPPGCRSRRALAGPPWASGPRRGPSGGAARPRRPTWRGRRGAAAPSMTRGSGPRPRPARSNEAVERSSVMG